MPFDKTFLGLLLKGKVYFVGGWTIGSDDDPESQTLVSQVECYDIVKDTWAVETEIPTPRYHSGAAVVGGKLYVVGGLTRQGHGTVNRPSDDDQGELERTRRLL